MKNSVVIGLLMGTISAVELSRHRYRDYELAMYDSPFGMDARHGWGGDEGQKIENKIDLGLGSSDDEDQDLEPSQEQINLAKQKLEMENQVSKLKKKGSSIQSFAQATESSSRKKSHKRKSSHKMT